ncbi:Zinc finger protein 277 [Labeo rohita]|uniref:Zinc finger protein 277 n=1 Tax=Labeo rohita TaxID=84645 RepID=A0ABQ8LF78_LABRO|nr:Zinc finger protein 277 [Labeo rohita]
MRHSPGHVIGGKIMAAPMHNTNLTAKQDCILEPLCFPEHLCGSASLASSSDGRPVTCALCSDSFPASEKDQLLKHMVLDHKLVIADVKLIADFPRYILYWKKRFTEQPITDFCSVIKTNSEGPVEQQEHYFLLCDALPEDRILREQLQQRRLVSVHKKTITRNGQVRSAALGSAPILCDIRQPAFSAPLQWALQCGDQLFNSAAVTFLNHSEEVLDQQQKERDDTTFHRACMFCNEEFTGNRSSLLNHMAKEHSFSIGLPDNIVYCNEFLDTLEWKLENMQCLYCEKTFRDKTTLKDHMRKKQHRRINARNYNYDRFYVINYLELGKTWEEVQSEDDRELFEDEDDDWSDWQAHPVCAVCLFCEQQAETMEKIYTHMEETHEFDLHKLKTDLSLKFYQQVKLVNYIRRELHQCRCYCCQENFETKEELVQHLVNTGHVMQLPEVSHWDQPQYYFPTYENDALLTALSDSESESEGPYPISEVPVIAEDISNLKVIKQTSVLNKLLKDRGGSN